MFYDVDEILKRYAAGEREFPGADICDSELEGVDLSGINLSGAELADSDLTRINLSGANLHNANISQSTVRNSNLSRANLSEAFLSESAFDEANLREANLSKANLRGAYFGSADLTGYVQSLINLSTHGFRIEILTEENGFYYSTQFHQSQISRMFEGILTKTF